MYSDDFETLFEEDVYTGRRKQRPGYPPDEDYNRRGWWRGCCCALVLMLLAGVGGAVLAVVFVGWIDENTAESHTTVIPVSATADGDEAALAPTETAAETVVATVPVVTRTATPTREHEPAFEAGATSPVVTALPSPTTSPAPTATRSTTTITDSSERFEFFAESSGFPRLVNVVDVSCSEERTDFTLLLDHSRDDDVVYLEVTLAAEGTEASLASIKMDTPDAPFGEQMIIAVGEDSTINTEVMASKTGAAIAAALDEAWTRERRHGSGVQEFTVTWYNTARQPDVAFRVTGLHPNRGGVLMSVRWSRDEDAPLTEVPLRFQICSP